MNDVINEEIARMVKMRVIQRSWSSYNLLILLVKKKDMVVRYRL